MASPEDISRIEQHLIDIEPESYTSFVRVYAEAMVAIQKVLMDSASADDELLLLYDMIYGMAACSSDHEKWEPFFVLFEACERIQMLLLDRTAPVIPQMTRDYEAGAVTPEALIDTQPVDTGKITKRLTGIIPEPQENEEDTGKIDDLIDLDILD